ncbi:Epsin-2 [Halotydeus destructor]|nr:Epsin-2 [Halotydeus destructor]
MNVKGIQRNMKNVVKNYSDSQVKVREATSNDHWGPSSTLMSEIADLTYNVVAFSEIMQMIWKRLNDHGKNWRHVYKALVLLEYLIKTGSEKVAQQCKENIFAIQTLKDFQYLEENKDQGMNVREKSKALVALLKDDEKLKVERARALKAKERFAQSSSYTSNSSSPESIPRGSQSYHESLGAGLSPEPRLPAELEQARPMTHGEEELQLQLALAMSKEEADAEERVRKNDDLRLQLAISESAKNSTPPKAPEKKSAIDDLLSLASPSPAPAAANFNNDPWSSSVPPPVASNGLGELFGAVGGLSPAQTAASADPWSPSPVNNVTPVNIADPWSAPIRSVSANNDPWQSSPPGSVNNTPDPWSATSDNKPASVSPSLLTASTNGMDFMSDIASIRKTPENFLGPNSNLVNLDALVTMKSTPSLSTSSVNPFASVVPTVANPFQAAKPPAPTINQLRSQTTFPGGADMPLQGLQFNQHAPMVPFASQPVVGGGGSLTTQGNNPFAM